VGGGSRAAGPLLLDKDGAAALIGITPIQFSRVRNAGWLPRPICFGRTQRWRAAELRLWIERDYPPRACWEAYENGERHRGPEWIRPFPPPNDLRGEGPPWLMKQKIGGPRRSNADLIWQRTTTEGRALTAARQALSSR
jgi:predicted DNA-binding transcriptional regulator AlpA